MGHQELLDYSAAMCNQPGRHFLRTKCTRTYRVQFG